MADAYGGRGGLTHQGGISVYGSGYYVGAKLNEACIIDCSGNTQSGLHIQPQSLDQIFSYQGNATGIRMDSGQVGISGMYYYLSTRLSTVVYANVIPLIPRGGFQVLASGFGTQFNTGVSGNAVDITAWYSMSGVLSSSGTSSKVAWIALGT